MASRPVFVPVDRAPFAHAVNVEFDWSPGFAKVQKQKSIRALHRSAITLHGFADPLEISSKSLQPLGVSLSAFNLMLDLNSEPLRACVEVVYQASKVFENGGPFLDLLKLEPRDAKRDSRLQSSGRLTGFLWHDRLCPLEPKTAFYDWVYLRALRDNPGLADGLVRFGFFTDIEFNPERSVNCQAHAAAVFVGMILAGLSPINIASFDDFVCSLATSSPTSSPFQQGTFDF